MKTFFLIVVALLLAGVVVTAQDDDFVFGDPLPTAPELAQRGSYSVGVRTMDVTNPDQFDLLNISDENPTATYDRTLTLEVWYPATLADGQEERVTYEDNLGRADADNLRPFTFEGRAARDADVNMDDGPYPLVVVSHGYPGSRLMMSNLTENLASKGYVVVSIAHQESTFTDVNEFGITLLYRAIDQEFVVNEIASMSESDDNFLGGLVDADNTAIIGYSMGGYGALNSIGAGYNATLEGFLGPLIASRLASNEGYADSIDPRIKAAVLVAPWGGDLGVFGIPGGMWDDGALAGIEIPTFWIAGSQDDVSQYPAIVNLYENAVNSDRYLLTYDNALHNVVPNPAPPEAVALGDYERYADPVWDTAHINNVNQHFVTAFLDGVLKGEDTSAYLDVAVENANEAVVAVDEEGEFTEDHTYWTGFSPRTALGLSLRHDLP